MGLNRHISFETQKSVTNLNVFSFFSHPPSPWKFPPSGGFAKLSRHYSLSSLDLSFRLIAPRRCLLCGSQHTHSHTCGSQYTLSHTWGSHYTLSYTCGSQYTLSNTCGLLDALARLLTPTNADSSI